MGLSDSWATTAVTGARMSAVDFVLRDLRQAIDAGIVRVGERLPSEAALAARYSVSRTVIREVLRSCESLGDRHPHRQGHVRGGRTTVPDDLRRVLGREPDGGPALHRGAGGGPGCAGRTEQQIETLQNLIEAMDVETDDKVWVGLDATFHVTIAEASHNPVFANILATIRTALAGQSGTSTCSRPGGRRPTRSIAASARRSPAARPWRQRTRCGSTSTR